MPPLSDENRALIRKLTVATRQGLVKWEALSATAFGLNTSFGQIRLVSVDGDGNHPYAFQIRNPDAIPIVESETIVGDRYAPWENEIAKLYDVARNSSLGIDNVLRGLQSELGLDSIADPNPDLPF